MGLTRLGSCFLLFLALYQVSWSSKCHSVALQQQQQQQQSSSTQAAGPSSREPSHGWEGSTTTRETIRRTSRRRIPLYELVDTKKEYACPKNLVLVNDTRFYPPDATARTASSSNTTITTRRIPRIIHVTSKSRCLTPAFAENLEKWKRTFPNYTFVLHNDEAMDRFLFDMSHDEFPHLAQVASACLHTAAGKADLWRALILYEYGGIYSDMDNAPGEIFNSSSIAHDVNNDNDNNNLEHHHDEAFFVVENEGMLSQYFFAAAPRHSLLYLLIQTTLQRVLQVPSVENQYVPFVTGPGALKAAFVEFMQAQLLLQQPNKKQQNQQQQQDDKDKDDKNSSNNKYDTYQKVRAGRYAGLYNWTVTVAGSARTGSQEYVQRNVIYQKRRIYQEMGMVHFSRIQKHHKEHQNNDYYYNPDESCLQRLYRLQQQQQERNSSNQ